ncbi:MAG: hypothetical protein E6J85_20025 [Deltaproteobacteria bacterium]|nr:MAG: hypothetical protein E6J85_20025 [Deltaproteobacteria bacterium]
MMLALRQRFTAALLFLPVGIVVLTLFTAGTTLLLASATVFFRDVRHLTEVLLQVLLYLSPILYDVAQLGSRGNWWFRVFRLELRLNPMSYLVPLFRDPVYYGRIPSLSSLGIACGCAVAMLLLGYGVFVRLEPRHIHHF